MELSELAARLQEDTERAVPPAGAASVQLARQLGAGATEFLLQQVAAHGDTAFLALEALREADAAAYNALPAQERATIYAHALQNNAFYNAWGVPEYQLTPTCSALMALGDAAVTALKPLLANRRLAPVRGSHNATMSSMYGNRVCDYAWVFINEILHRPYEYAQDPAERDREIAALQQELQGSPGAAGEVH
jgi:hypothetical protein